MASKIDSGNDGSLMPFNKYKNYLFPRAVMELLAKIVSL